LTAKDEVTTRGAEAEQSSLITLSLTKLPRASSQLQMTGVVNVCVRRSLPWMKSMNCSECRDLYRVFELRSQGYLEARSAAFFMVSTRIAARKHVDLQRALNDLHEHQEECPWAIAAEHVGRVAQWF
jgi:hypothetical protein